MYPYRPDMQCKWRFQSSDWATLEKWMCFWGVSGFSFFWSNYQSTSIHAFGEIIPIKLPRSLDLPVSPIFDGEW